VPEAITLTTDCTDNAHRTEPAPGLPSDTSPTLAHLLVLRCRNCGATYIKSSD
jgi:hypothetical protein